MDRDTALQLLTGGKERIAEWNQRREAGGEIPPLSMAVLIRAKLSGANLSMADLTGATLT
jgi:uncharacterized protein YjbI with pentapeptide repeats